MCACDTSVSQTASLLARSCHSVAVLARAGDDATEECAREYGRHLGIAFQLIDDVLDVVQSTAQMGKETSVDMKLGVSLPLTVVVISVCLEQ